MSLKSLKSKALQDEKVHAEYDNLADEFDFIDTLVTMRSRAGLTQEELAQKINTAKSNISRLERGRGNPSWHTLEKYAGACGYRLRLAIETPAPAE